MIKTKYLNIILINEYIITDYEPFISGENVKIRLAGFEVSNNSTVFIYANPKEYYQISIDDIINKVMSINFLSTNNI